MNEIQVICPKCGCSNEFGEFQWQKKCDKCGENIWTTNTYCFYCGKVTTHLQKECDNPVCLEMYRMVKEDKRHPFFVTEYQAKQNLGMVN